MNWKEILGFGWRAGVVLGGLLGFQEGFVSSTVTSGPSTNIPLTSIPKLIQVFYTPIFAEALLWGVAMALLALLLYLVLGRFTPLFREEARFVPFFSGLATGLVGGVYLFTMFNPSYSLHLMITPSMLFFNMRLVLAGVLIAMAVGLLAARVHGRPGWLPWKGFLAAFGFWTIVIVPLVLWVNRVYLDYTLNAKFILCLGGFFVLLLLCSWATGRFLAVRYREGRGRSIVARHQLTMVLLLLAGCTFLPMMAKTAEFNLARVASTAEQDLNVALISVDTLRADRLSVYNPDGPRTPNLDRLAAEGVVFTATQTLSPWTLPSLCTIHTSMYPTAHGVTSTKDRLDDLRVTLAETLSDAGLMTGAVVSNGWLLEVFGANQGFRVYDHLSHRQRTYYWVGNIWFRLVRNIFRRNTPRVDTGDSSFHVRYALEFLEDNRGNNFFLWLHAIDPHEPYVARDRWREEAGLTYKSLQIPRFNSGKVVDFRKGILLKEKDRLHVEDLYNREVEYTDAQLGVLLDRMAEMGLMKNTMIIFTSDHGEEFWEHSDVSHGHSYFTELMRVPMIIRLPDGYPVVRRRIDAQVRLIDVAPTILDYLGQSDMVQAEGESLLPLITGEEEPTDRPAFYESMIYYRELKGYSDGEFKYVLDEETGEDQLYHLGDDHGERVDIAADDPERRLAMKSTLMDHLKRQRALYDSLDKSDGTAEMDEATRAHLRALGYLQ